MDAAELQSLIDDRTQESLYLEFKRGEALNLQNNARGELVKDVTGFANADGGCIIYGIAEERVDGIPCAASLAPVVAADMTKEWINSVIRDNTSPKVP